MHYHVEVLVPPEVEREHVEGYVHEVLRQFSEHLLDSLGDCPHELGWDWYQISGRWRGVHHTGDGPVTDDLPPETCDLCRGTGKRHDLDELREQWSEEHFAHWMETMGGCNACYGKGETLPWPTQWGAHPSDIARNRHVRTDLLPPYAVVDLDGEVRLLEGAEQRQIARIQADLGVDPGDPPAAVSEAWRPEHPDVWLVTTDWHS